MATPTAKAFVGQVLEAAAQGPTPTILGTDCARFWLQGVVVSAAADGARCAIDDGTGVIAIDLRTFRKSIPPGMATPLGCGDLIMVVGPLLRRASTTTLSPVSLSDAESEHAILAHQIMSVANQPQQDSIWFLEVVEYWRNARS